MTGPLPPAGCPDDAELAALADGTLAIAQRAQIAEHVGACQRCLDHVGALVRLGRVEAAPLPADLRARVAAVSGRTTRGLGGWRAGLSAAALVGISLGGWFYSQPGSVVPAGDPGGAVEQERSRSAAGPAPVILRPSANQRVARGPIDLQWQPTASAIGYRARVMRDDGTLLWEAESAGSSLQVPGTADLPVDTPLYVSVTALMPDGKTARAPSVRFEIAAE